jgi:hypothetical protein
MDEYQLEFATGFGESYQHCPACSKELISGHSECYFCGLIISRYEDNQEFIQTKASIGGIEHLTKIDVAKLDKKWKQVVVNYHDQKNHQNFIKSCQSLGAIPFAVYHYTKMLEIDKDDDIAQIMRRQALSRLVVNFENVKELKTQIPTFTKIFILIKWFNWIGLFLSTSCIVAGLIMPDAKNLVGLGVAFFALFIALTIYRR